MPPSYWPVGKFVGHFLDLWLMWEGQPTVRSAIPGQVVLGDTRKQAEHHVVQASKQYPFMASASIPAWVPVLTSLHGGF